MGDVVSRLSGGEIIGMLAVGGGLLTAILTAVVGIIAGCWRSARQAEIEANLKQQMLTRGMSAAEIEQVLKASASTTTEEKVAFTGIVNTDKAVLVKIMAENGLEGDDIARILQAFDAPVRGADSPESMQQMRQKAEVVGNLLEQEMEAKDIEKVLRAFQADRAQNKERIAKG
jgi:SOS response regulatory protein OraA/RecX